MKVEILVESPESEAEFKKRFGTEKRCLDFLFEQHYPEGFRCEGKKNKCDSQKCYRLGVRKRIVQCANPKCRKQRSLTKDTAFEGLKGSLVRLFKLLWLMRRPDFNASRAHRTLHRRKKVDKKVTWVHAHKLRRVFRNALAQTYSWRRCGHRTDFVRNLRAPDFAQRPEPATKLFAHILGLDPPLDDGDPTRATFLDSYKGSMGERHHSSYLDEHALREQHRGFAFVEEAARFIVRTRAVTYERIIGRRALRSWTVVLAEDVADVRPGA